MAEIEVLSLPTTTITQVAGYPINDSVIATLIVSFIILLAGIFVRSKINIVPGKFQVAIEGIVEFFLKQLTVAWGSEERAKKYLPFVLGIFLFLFIANQFSVIPLMSAVMADGVTALRTPSSDLGLTVTLGVMVVIGSHLIALASHPFRHIGNYIRIHEFLKVRSFMDLFNACLAVFLGILDIIGEGAKIMSMSCRLFGNIFAGEVMVAVISGLVAYVVPMPFIAISFFSGIVQSFVFTLLAVNFMPGIIKAAEPAPAHA